MDIVRNVRTETARSLLETAETSIPADSSEVRAHHELNPAGSAGSRRASVQDSGDSPKLADEELPEGVLYWGWLS